MKQYEEMTREEKIELKKELQKARKEHEKKLEMIKSQILDILKNNHLSVCEYNIVKNKLDSAVNGLARM